MSHSRFPNTRLRRLRMNATLRGLVQETELHVHDCILPLFIRHGEKSLPIKTMPGHYRLCLNDLPREIETIQRLGIKAVLLFGIPAEKDATGSKSYDAGGIIQQAIRIIKHSAPELLVITDVCFCEYMDHGHCGIVHEKNGVRDVDNDTTLTELAKQAVSHAQAGADIVAPSGMMDGTVQAIRHALDHHHFQHIPILSYSVKYASAFYGPFREAAEYTLQFGDRQTYQMNPGNAFEALREAELDIQEGADILMVKPAMLYLDIITRIKQQYPGVPLAAYQVSGEFSMIKAAAEKGLIDEKKAALETVLSIKRAGADFIITYFAKEISAWLKNKSMIE